VGCSAVPATANRNYISKCTGKMTVLPQQKVVQSQQSRFFVVKVSVVSGTAVIVEATIYIIARSEIVTSTMLISCGYNNKTCC